MSYQSTTIEIHPAAEIFPMMDPVSLAKLTTDIEQNGLHEWIELYDGKIIDGRNRLEACRLAGVEPQFCELENDDLDVPAYVLSKNLHRRHLSDSQRAMVAARAKDFYAEQAKERQGTRNDLKADGNIPENLPESKGDARDQAGAAVGVSGRSVDHATTVLEKGSKDLQRAVDAGEVSVSKAATIVKELPKAKQLAAAKEKPNHECPPSTKRKGLFSLSKRKACKKHLEAVANLLGEAGLYEGFAEQLEDLTKRIDEI